jgi:hypothetical protein
MLGCHPEAPTRCGLALLAGAASETRKFMMLTVPQIATLTGRSRRTIIRWFENEPDVVLLSVFDHPEELHKRRYRTLRIPRAVFERVIQTKKSR